MRWTICGFWYRGAAGTHSPPRSCYDSSVHSSIVTVFDQQSPVSQWSTLSHVLPVLCYKFGLKVLVSVRGKQDVMSSLDKSLSILAERRCPSGPGGSVLFFFFLSFFDWGGGVELKALGLLSRCSTTWALPWVWLLSSWSSWLGHCEMITCSDDA
jgi:hypothetical protein